MIAAVTDTVYAIAAGAMAPALVRARIFPPAARYVTGFTLVGLGLFTALAPSHRAK